MVRSFTARLVADTRCGLGESPFWDEDAEVLSWVDIEASMMHRFSDGDAADPSPLPNETSFVALARGGGVVAVHPLGVDLMGSDGHVRQVASGWLDPVSSRPNDGAVDSHGRLWMGSTTRDRSPGSGAIGVVIAGAWEERMLHLTLPNGIGWSPDNRTIYYVDTFAGTLWRADFDLDAATVGRSDPFLEIPTDDGFMDGLCVDSMGSIWVAIWGGASVLCFDPAGRLAAEVSVAAPKVTSCAFGGETLFITTADAQGDDPPGSGGLFAVDVGVEGALVEPAHLG
jgi:sugar lactone lactonase YvrE